MVKMNGFAAIDNARQLRYMADKAGKAQMHLPPLSILGKIRSLPKTK